MSTREDILSFLRDPSGFAGSHSAASRQLWLAGLDWTIKTLSAAGSRALRTGQISAWKGIADQRAALVLGPPGTGKTFALSWMALGYVRARKDAGLPCRVLLTGFTRNSIANLLEAVDSKAREHFGAELPIHYLGSLPPDGLPSTIIHSDARTAKDVRATLEPTHCFIGCTVWTLHRVLQAAESRVGHTAPIFDLVCIDEASQMVLSQGLMCLAGLATDGRVLIAGDNKQLEPIRGSQDRGFEIDGRPLSSSLYDFVEAAEVKPFVLDETFRLNRPLTEFPAAQFYNNEYRSAQEVAERRLQLIPTWKEALEPWEEVVLDPEHPLVVLLHDGPPMGTQNPFEKTIVCRVVDLLHQRMLPVAGSEQLEPKVFWEERLAVVTPHRAQNAAIREALQSRPSGSGCVVETVDRIQGRERDAILASYTVSDPEFALVEGAFIFSSQRLNVTITRAKSKLVLVLSRRLLEVIPPDEKVFDAAQALRDFVLGTESAGAIKLRDEKGVARSVEIRVRRFDQRQPLRQLEPTTIATPVRAPLPSLTSEHQLVFDAIKEIALGNKKFGSAADFEVNKKLLRSKNPVSFAVFHDLQRHGMITLREQTGQYGPFWVARPLFEPVVPFPADRPSVTKRIDEVLEGIRRNRRLKPFYAEVRDRFDWIGPNGEDALRPVFQDLVDEGILTWDRTPSGQDTIDRATEPPTDRAPVAPPSETLTLDDFKVLNALEDTEVRRLNFGVFENWTRVQELSALVKVGAADLEASVRRLEAHGHLMRADAVRIRSRMAELGRELRYVKQRFAKGDAARRPFLVRSLKVVTKDRNKPTWSVPLETALAEARGRLHAVEGAGAVLDGLSTMLARRWGTTTPALAGFQARSLAAILAAWAGASSAHSFVVTADTGAGKTEAACLPILAGALLDRLRGVKGTRAVLVYPRVRLGANQAKRLVGYISALAETGLPALSMGLQNFQVLPSAHEPVASLSELYPKLGSRGYGFPFFTCPDCDCDLRLDLGEGTDGLDRLSCTSCKWTYSHWNGTKAGVRRNPPNVFLPVTESLHHWLGDERCGALFGDDATFAPPRVVLADEIHLYSHIHGAQVGYALRRLLARCDLNAQSHAKPGRTLAIGMSATLGDAARVWGQLIGRDPGEVGLLAPTANEREPNPKGREYFYFVQPEVESRGRDVAGAATTIQSLMCLSHGMRRRTGEDGGYRAIAFLDSIDKLKRIHGDFTDAEEDKRLAQYRTFLFDDDPHTGDARSLCCKEPASCDRFENGECWYFAANDRAQWTVSGRYRPGQALAVCRQPIFSGARGRVDEIIQKSDIVFSTSSLEVGYDDPDMMLVYQHYAPVNLASFVQRKGRGGRGADDRPVAAVTLSVYSPRDSWYFRRPSLMLDATSFEVPLNVDNYFVRRGQVLATLLDAVARLRRRGETVGLGSWGLPTATDPVIESLLPDLLARVFGPEVWSGLGYESLRQLVNAAQAVPTTGEGADDETDAFAPKHPWIPRQLFASINLPALQVVFEDENDRLREQEEDITLAFSECAPGNMTRRWGFQTVHWIVPAEGRAPLLSSADSEHCDWFDIGGGEPDAIARSLPLSVRASLGNVHSKIARPKQVRVERAGKMWGGSWSGVWQYDKRLGQIIKRSGDLNDDRPEIDPKCRGQLRGFVVVDANPSAGTLHAASALEKIAPGVVSFTGGARASQATGLSVARVFWAVDAHLKLRDRDRTEVTRSQIFAHPDSGETLLHGYKLETEGVQLRVNTNTLDEFVRSESSYLASNPDEDRWLRGQFIRFLIQTHATSCGLSQYEAPRVADLLVTIDAIPELRKELGQLIRRWDGQKMAALLRRAHHDYLQEHPLITVRRVDQTAEAVGTPRFRDGLKTTLDAAKDPTAFAGFLRSLVLHGLAVRLGQLFVLHGRGDERRVLTHVKLPIQFGPDANDVITVLENGNNGDGTTRTFLAHLDEAFAEWTRGGLASCPSADEDAVLRRLLSATERHRTWRAWDPRSRDRMADLAQELGLSPDEENPGLTCVTRALYGVESIGAERFALFDLHLEVERIRSELTRTMSREPTAWELVGAIVCAAQSAAPSTPQFAKLLKAYEGVEQASGEESLRPTSRLADQAYRLSARLCVDGCQACLHSGSDVMPDALAEVAVSRRVLARFASVAFRP